MSTNNRNNGTRAARAGARGPPAQGMVINFQIAPPAQLVGRQTLRSQSWPNIRILRALRSQQQAAVINTIRFFSNFQGFQHQNYHGEIEVFLRAFAQGLAGPRPSLTVAQSPIQEGFTKISNIHIFYDIQGFHGPHGQLERAARALGEGLSGDPLRGYPLHGGTVVVSGSSSITLFGGSQGLQNHEGQLDRALRAFAEGLMGRQPAPTPILQRRKHSERYDSLIHSEGNRTLQIASLETL